jgi:hypothetical protein
VRHARIGPRLARDPRFHPAPCGKGILHGTVNGGKFLP